jgi:hypothetical protein
MPLSFPFPALVVLAGRQLRRSSRHVLAAGGHRPLLRTELMSCGPRKLQSTSTRVISMENLTSIPKQAGVTLAALLFAGAGARADAPSQTRTRSG